MTVRTRTITFGIDRSPSLRKIRLGFETDNLVERLEFILPKIAENQTAVLMMGGRYANAVTLNQEDNGRYFVELTAALVGADGEIEAYIRIDGAGGEVWNSDVMRLTTGALPDVDTDIENLYPSAVEQMLKAIAEHRAEMEIQTAEVGGLTQRAQEAERSAADSAQTARASENNAAESAEDADNAAQAAGKFHEGAAQSAKQAEIAADRAEQAAATNGYVFFEVDDRGHLIMTKTENVGNLDFRLNDGRLEVVYG